MKPLVNSTQSALLELNRKLYQTTLYQDSYRNHCRQYLSPPIPLLPRQQGLRQQQQPSPDRKPSDTFTSSIPISASGKDKENIDEEETDDVEGVVDDDKEEEHDEGDEEAGEDGSTNLSYDLKKSDASADTDSVIRVTRKSVSFNDTPQIMENTHSSLRDHSQQADDGCRSVLASRLQLRHREYQRSSDDRTGRYRPNHSLPTISSRNPLGIGKRSSDDCCLPE